MATLSGATIKVEAHNATQVKVTIRYVLTPSALDKLAGAVFSEKIELWGDDGLIDQLRYTFTNSSYAVSAATATVSRTRTAIVSKNAMNEDPEQGAMGQEVNDEIYGKITVTYAANKPIGASEPTPATTSVVVAAWKPTGFVIGPLLEEGVVHPS